MSRSIAITLLTQEFAPVSTDPYGPGTRTFKAFTANEDLRLRADIRAIESLAGATSGRWSNGLDLVTGTISDAERRRVPVATIAYADVVIEEFASCSNIRIARTEHLFEVGYGRDRNGMRAYHLTSV